MKEEMSVLKKYGRRSQLQDVWHRFRKNKGALTGGMIVLFLILCAIFSPLVFDYDTQIVGQNVMEKLMKPNAQHWFGTDNLGRDLFARIIYGTRASLPVGFVAVMIALSVGMVLGAIAGYVGGIAENVIMRLMDIIGALPGIMLAIALIAVMGTGTFSLMVAVGTASVPTFARVTRAAVLSVRNQDYVESARAIGMSNIRILFGHIIPNCLSPIIVQTTLRIGSAIISAAALSYLGLGVPAPVPEWGALLSDGRSYLRDYSYLTLFPGLIIMITVIAFNLLGDGLRDSLDPKLKQ